MVRKYSNPCTRCGKERIKLREWTEKIPTFSGGLIEVTNTDNVCPDPECQKIVQKELDQQRKKRDAIKQAREDRIQENVTRKHNLLLKK